MVPTEEVEAAQRFSLASACFCNCLEERMLRSQNQNAEIASERTKTKENEKFLSAIVIKNLFAQLRDLLAQFPHIARKEKRAAKQLKELLPHGARLPTCRS
jgi:hypothetical protein